MHKHEYAEICKKKYAEICKKYANICICPMSLPQLHIYAKICKKYAKYASMKFICIICTPHFADGLEEEASKQDWMVETGKEQCRGGFEIGTCGRQTPGRVEFRNTYGPGVAGLAQWHKNSRSLKEEGSKNLQALWLRAAHVARRRCSSSSSSSTAIATASRIWSEKDLRDSAASSLTVRPSCVGVRTLSPQTWRYILNCSKISFLKLTREGAGGWFWGRVMAAAMLLA